MHVHSNRARWCAHRVLWDAIEVELAPDSAWTRDAVLDACLELHTTERRVGYGACRAGARRNAAQSLLVRPRRSSSLVEAFNSTLRVLQMKHRNVSDDLLSLHALASNLRVRKEGQRRGRSSYEWLGVEFARQGRPWCGVLIEEMDRA